MGSDTVQIRKFDAILNSYQIFLKPIYQKCI